MGGRTAVVVGGGIGGLAAAVALGLRGWRVSVLERSPEFTEAGAGLSLWPNAMRALAALGLADRVRGIGAVEVGGGVRDRAGRWLSRTDNAEIARRHGLPLVVVHRAELVRVLVGALPPEALKPGVDVLAARQDGVVEHRGGVLRADVVVGADGLHSGVRRQCWPEAAEPRRTGYTAWRGVTAPVPEVVAEGAVFWGRGERIGFTAVPGDRFYCFAVTRGASSWERFRDWPEPIPRLLAAVPEGGALGHELYDLPALPSFARGRVALLGDAAHAMSPALGQGACQALEDAVTLADCLDGAEVGEALRRYDRMRRRRTQQVVRRSARMEAVARWAWPPAVALRDLAARLTPAAVALRSMDPVLGWTP